MLVVIIVVVVGGGGLSVYLNEHNTRKQVLQFATLDDTGSLGKFPRRF